jgi:hypothetical protein
MTGSSTCDPMFGYRKKYDCEASLIAMTVPPIGYLI